MAGETPPPSAATADLVGCWVSPGWSCEILVERREGWDDVELGPGGPKGIALVLVAQAGRHDRVSVCGYLVDLFCLGVKNVIGPEEMRRRDVPAFVRTYFMALSDVRRGAHDDPVAVIETLRTTVGDDGFAVAA